jgi:hypothetical protein
MRGDVVESEDLRHAVRRSDTRRDTPRSRSPTDLRRRVRSARDLLIGTPRARNQSPPRGRSRRPTVWSGAVGERHRAACGEVFQVRVAAVALSEGRPPPGEVTHGDCGDAGVGRGPDPRAWGSATTPVALALGRSSSLGSGPLPADLRRLLRAAATASLAGHMASRTGRWTAPAPRSRRRGSRPTWPREESNLRTRIRSPSLYPLSYGARLRGWRMGLEPTTTWTTTRGSTN